MECRAVPLRAPGLGPSHPTTSVHHLLFLGCSPEARFQLVRHLHHLRTSIVYCNADCFLSVGLWLSALFTLAHVASHIGPSPINASDHFRAEGGH